MRRRAAWFIAACLVTSTLTIAQLKGDQQPAFRTTARSVEVSVSVQDGNRPVAGLTVANFVLTDNGVAQTLSIVDSEHIPLDVTLLLDLSGSAADVLRQTQQDTERIVALLRDTDRIRIVTVGQAPGELMPLQQASTAVVPALRSGGSSAIYDTLAAAFITVPAPGRRKLIVATTDAVENSSVMELSDLEMLARRSDAVLSFVFNDPVGRRGVFFHHTLTGASMEKGASGLRQIALLTGGDPGDQLWPGRTDAVSVFKKLFETFRQSYVLRYEPTGVVAGGWHDLNVTLTGTRRYTVRFRRGYDDR